MSDLINLLASGYCPLNDGLDWQCRKDCDECLKDLILEETDDESVRCARPYESYCAAD